MTAAAISGSKPLLIEGNEYWKRLMEECKRQTEAVNSIISENGLSSDHCVRCSTGSELRMSKSANPSTIVKLLIGFYPWGPMLSLAITGHQSDDWDFFPEECEMPIAMEGDGTVVAIYDEGRSFSPGELAAYLTQAFRRCFPGVCLCR